MIDDILTDEDRFEEFRKYGIELSDLLNLKNRGYGNAVAVTGKEGVYVRMFDKFSRVLKVSMDKSKELSDEKLRDTIQDIAGYAVLWLMINDHSRIFYNSNGTLKIDSDWRNSTWVKELQDILDDPNSEIIICQRCDSKSFDKYWKKCYNCDGGLESVELGGETNKDPLKTNQTIRRTTD